jgi:glycerol-3-phosphate acyltransferase PlsY
VLNEMTLAIEVLLAGLVGYVLGSVPTGVLVSRAFGGIDVLRFGSGHTGGLNVARAAGVWAGALTAAGDVLLAAGAVTLTRLVAHSPWAAAVAGVMTVVGHNWSVWIGFRGGIGLSSLGGSLISLAPLETLATAGALVLVWLALTRVFRVHRARTTILAMVVLSPLLWLLSAPLSGVAMGAGGAVAVILKSLEDWHRQY